MAFLFLEVTTWTMSPRSVHPVIPGIIIPYFTKNGSGRDVWKLQGFASNGRDGGGEDKIGGR